MEGATNIKDFVTELFKDLEEGLKERNMQMCKEEDAHAKMELNAIATGESSKGLDFKISLIKGGLEGKNTSTDSQKITVFVRKKPSVLIR